MTPVLSRSALTVGDTVLLHWELPAGAHLITGPKADDSLAVTPAGSGSWILQPLAAGMHGGDTLCAVVGRDTLKEPVPRFQVRSQLSSARDTAVDSLLPPEEVPVPFPWLVLFLALLVMAAAIFGWHWWKKHPRRHVEPVPAPAPAAPVIDPLTAARRQLDALEERAGKGLSPRETAFEAGEIMRLLHRALFDFSLAAESTSREWLDWADGRLGPAATGALRQFLAEADRLRYAGVEADALPLFAAARQVVREAEQEWERREKRS